MDQAWSELLCRFCTALWFEGALSSWRILGQLRCRASGPWEQLTATVGADATQFRFGTRRTERALE